MRQQALHGRNIVRFIARQLLIRQDRIAKASQLAFHDLARLLAVIAALGKIDGRLAVACASHALVTARRVSASRVLSSWATSQASLPTFGCTPGRTSARRPDRIRAARRLPTVKNSYPRTSFMTAGSDSSRSTGVLITLNTRDLLSTTSPPVCCALLTEFAGLSRAPFRIEIAGRQDGNQNSGLLELRDDFVGENIVALQFLVSPDLRLAAEAHAQHGFSVA